MFKVNMLKVLATTFIMFLVTGCAVSVNEIVKPIKKEFIYKREDANESLNLRVKQIIDAMSQNNLELINKKFIHPTFGVYNFYKVNGIEIFSFQTMIYNVIDENEEEFSHIISRVTSKDTKLPILQEKVSFNCSPNDDKYYGWDKEGLFVNADTKSHLSDYMNETNKVQQNRYTKEDFHKAKLIERTGYKVVLTPEIVFYMTKIDKKWYLTLIDRITTDCSSEKRNK